MLSSYPQGKQDFTAVVPKRPDNVQLPPNVTIDELPMGGDNHEGGMPSAPSFEIVPGYGEISSNDALLMPPSYDEALRLTEPPNRPGFHPVPLISEGEARQAMLEHCNQHCCYGEGAATNMAVTKMESSSAFHYILESFGEARETAWKSNPYRGGTVDGPENGPAPLPWEIPAFASVKFKDEKKRIEVPHTAYVKNCSSCCASGQVTCSGCYGSGKVGSGDEETMCSSCYGSGQVETNHLEDYILERTAMPDKKIRKVQGQNVFEEEAEWVYPVTQCPEHTVNEASADLVAKHRTQFSTERILLQRHKIRVVPVTEVNADWKDKHFTFFVYGFEHKVYSNNYPQACCCGCSVL